jgi:hypothetical protein
MHDELAWKELWVSHRAILYGKSVILHNNEFLEE